MAEEQSLSQKAAGWPAQVKDYFQELQLEMKRVTWPSWKQVRATTGVVIVAVFAFAAYFALVDTLVSEGLKRLMNSFNR
ncbi:MAG: preprotein translocase subunit SecE [Bryobacterales bacterium]|nr:preprotein translocase subunit SecE [Bryobacterales bacterium]MBV9397981.1 preprotein translocase subunit SecE [Bryobacterales bacterium]